MASMKTHQGCLSSWEQQVQKEEVDKKLVWWKPIGSKWNTGRHGGRTMVPLLSFHKPMLSNLRNYQKTLLNSIQSWETITGGWKNTKYDTYVRDWA
jgi:hypothetical protein